MSPAFDINPSPDKVEHVLNIDLVNNRPDLGTALSAAAYYRLTGAQAQTIVDQTLKVAAQWKTLARLAGVSSSEIVIMESAFMARSAWATSHNI